MNTDNCDFITIIASTADAAMRQYRAQGLDKAGYAIASQVGRHDFQLVSPQGTVPLFTDNNMYAAIFMRTPQATR